MNEELRKLYALLLQGAQNGPVPERPKDYSEAVRGVTEDDFVKRYSDRAELNGFLEDLNTKFPNFFQGTNPQQVLAHLAPVDQRLRETRDRADAKYKVVAPAINTPDYTKMALPPSMPSDMPAMMTRREDEMEIKKTLRGIEFAQEFKPGEVTVEEFYAGQFPEKIEQANRNAALVAKEFQKKYPDGKINPYKVVYGSTGAKSEMTADEILRAESIPGIDDEGLLLTKRTVKQQQLILAEQKRNAVNLYDSWMNDVYSEHVTPEIQEALNLVEEVIEKQNAKQPVDQAKMAEAMAAQEMLDNLPPETKKMISAVAKGSIEAQFKREQLDRDYPELRIVEALNKEIQDKKDARSLREEEWAENKGFAGGAALAVWRTLRGAVEVIPKGAEELASTYNAVSAVWSDDAKARLIRRANRDVMPGTLRDSTKDMRPPLEQTAWLEDKDTGQVYEIGYDHDGKISNIYNSKGYQARLTDSHYNSLYQQAEEADLFDKSKTRINGSAMFNQVVDGTTDLAITYLLARGLGSLGKAGRVGKFLESSGPIASRVRESVPILFQYTGRIAEEGIRQGLSPEAAVTYGGLGSVSEALIESAVPFLGKVTGARRAALRESMQRILANPAELKKLKSGAFKEMAVFGTFGEMGEEMAAVEIQPITNSAVNALFDSRLETDRSPWQEYVTSGALGLFISAVPGIIGGISNARRIASDDFLKESIYSTVLEADKANEIASLFNDPKYSQLGAAIQETQARTRDIIEDKTIPARRKVELVAKTFDVVKREMDLEAAKGTGSQKKVQDDLDQRVIDLNNERASVDMPDTDERPLKTRVQANANGRISPGKWTAVRPGDIVQVQKSEVGPDGIRLTDELQPAEVEYVDPDGEYIQFKAQGKGISSFRRYNIDKAGSAVGSHIYLPEETVEDEEGDQQADTFTDREQSESVNAASQREVQAKREDLERRRKAELQAPSPGTTPDMINAKYDAELAAIENPEPGSEGVNSGKLNAKYDAELAALEDTEKTGSTGKKQEVTVETENATMEGSLGDTLETGDREITLPEPGLYISGVSLKEGVEKGKGFGQEVYLKALEEYGRLYSAFPVSEDARRVHDALEKKGLITVREIEVEGIPVRVIEKAEVSSQTETVQTDVSTERTDDSKSESEPETTTSELEGAVSGDQAEGTQDNLPETPVGDGKETQIQAVPEEDVEDPNNPTLHTRANGTDITYADVRELEMNTSGKLSVNDIRAGLRLGPVAAKALFDAYTKAKKKLKKIQRATVDAQIVKKNESKGQGQETRESKSTPGSEKDTGSVKGRFKTVRQKITYAESLGVGNNVRGMVMQYLLAKKINASIITELFGQFKPQKGRGAKRKHGEVLARLGSKIPKAEVYLSETEGAKSTQALGDEIWNYFGMPENVEPSELRSVVEEVIAQHNTRSTIADELIDGFSEDTEVISEYDKRLIAELQDDFRAGALTLFLDNLTDEELTAITEDQYDFENSPEYQEWLRNEQDELPEEERIETAQRSFEVLPEDETPPPLKAKVIKLKPAPSPAELLKGLENKLVKVFKLNKTEAEVAARVIDRMFHEAAEREGIPLDEMYASVNLVSGDLVDAKKLVKNAGLSQEVAQRIAGAQWVEDGKTIVAAFVNPNITTPLHEVAHVFEKYLTEGEKAEIMRAGGYSSWSDATSEYFARGFERYLAEGVAPSIEMQVIFDKLKSFFLDVYNSIIGSKIDVQISPGMRQIYARMLGYNINPTNGAFVQVPDFNSPEDVADFLLGEPASILERARQLSLFDIPGETEVETGTGQKESVKFNSNGQVEYPVEPVPEGEFSDNEKNIRTVSEAWEENHLINFTGDIKVKGPADVAHIMRLLEDRSVEHMFAVHVDEFGLSHIQHISTGNAYGTIVDPKQILAGVQRFKSKKIYLVHNHPSGNVQPSSEDVRLTEMITDMLDPLSVGVEHVIMDTYTQEYAVFSSTQQFLTYTRENKPADQEYVYATHTFHGFKHLTSPVSKISMSSDAAGFVYGLRFSALPKAGVLILNRRSEVIGNYVFKDRADKVELMKLLGTYPLTAAVIMYGNTPFDENIRGIVKHMKLVDAKVLDYVHIQGGTGDVEGAYASAMDEGKMVFMETQERYGTNVLREAGPLFGGGIQTDLFSAMNNTEPSLKPEKATEEALRRQANFDRKLLAPNGEPSKLSPEQYAMVRTPEFKAWFGDWENDPKNASKALDENGEPLLMYHGTNSAFDVFESIYGGGYGHYFTPDKNYAQYFLERYRANREGKPNVMEVFLNIRDPLRISIPINHSAVDRYSSSDMFKKEGFDSIRGIESVLGEAKGPEVVVVFQPNQIKSATDNAGTFDPSNPSILFQDPGTSKQRILDRLRVVAPSIGLKGIRAEDIYKAKQAEMDAAGVSVDDINAVIMAHVRPDREQPLADTLDIRNSSAGEEIISYTMTTSDETNKMLSGATWQDVFGEKPEGNQLYYVSKLNDMLQDGKTMTSAAARNWGASVLEYGPPLFDLIKKMSDDMSNKKAVLLATFLGELQQAKVTNTGKTKEIARFENQVFAYYQHYMNIQGKRVAAGRLIRLYRDRFLSEIYEDMILEEKEIKARKAVEQALNIPVEDKGTPPAQITEAEKKRLDDIAKQRSESDKIEHAQKRKSAPSQAQSRAQMKVNEILSKTGLPDMQAFMDRLRDSSKNVKCP